MRERWIGRESDDQVLVGLMRDAHICSRSSDIYTVSLSLPVMAGGKRRR